MTNRTQAQTQHDPIEALDDIRMMVKTTYMASLAVHPAEHRSALTWMLCKIECELELARDHLASDREKSHD